MDTLQSRIAFSAAPDYLGAAEDELRTMYPAAALERLGPDAGCLSVPGISIGDVAAACCERPVVFVRHLLAEVARLPISRVADDPSEVNGAAVELLQEHDVGREIALQVWASGSAALSYRTDELWRAVAERVRSDGYAVARGGKRQVLSVLVAERHVVLGFNRREDALTDWPGGRVSLAKRREQVSRSEFKLEELFKVFDVQLPVAGVALDLGASPGGWTRLLRQRGLAVWAVDPGDLHPMVAADPLVHHLRSTAGEFLRASSQRFDLVVNDMRMTPERSCAAMLEAARYLELGGPAIMTLKITPDRPLRTVERCFRMLGQGYEAIFARQLHHNRNEITVVACRKP